MLILLIDKSFLADEMSFLSCTVLFKFIYNFSGHPYIYLIFFYEFYIKVIYVKLSIDTNYGAIFNMQTLDTKSNYVIIRNIKRRHIPFLLYKPV